VSLCVRVFVFVSLFVGLGVRDTESMYTSLCDREYAFVSMYANLSVRDTKSMYVCLYVREIVFMSMCSSYKEYVSVLVCESVYTKMECWCVNHTATRCSTL